MIQQLKPVEKTPNMETVTLLTELLAEAVNGNIQAVAVAGVNGAGQSFNCFDAGRHTMLLSAELTVLQRDFTDCLIQLRCPPNNEDSSPWDA